ncbi:hypothetical protein M5D96_012108 [Drosophila gunungcola]|uniref:Uncharacterized protein n=1 Tax=Drosophila gunungcola TaxID=103775 RepID=A0A9P9YE05_9MUSC|nr:hypothetical protein M5D96_012108 [Drosophila gunungcola]
MEQPSEKQQDEEAEKEQEQEDHQREEPIEEYIEKKLEENPKSLEREEDKEPPTKDISKILKEKGKSEEIKDIPDNLRYQDSEEDQALEDLEEEEYGLQSAEAKFIGKYQGMKAKLVEETLEENVVHKDELKETEKFDEDPLELKEKLGDQVLEKEEKSKEKNTNAKVTHLEDQTNTDVLEKEEALKVIEKLFEIPENKKQLTEKLEDLAEKATDEDSAGEFSQDSLPQPNGDHTQNEQNKEILKKTPKEQEKSASAPEEDLPNEQVTQFLQHLVTQLWPELGANPELRLNRASAKGDNYLGVVWRLQVGSDSKSKPGSLVVKLPPQNRVRRKQFFARPCFLRETAAYEVFLPLAEMIQERCKIPMEDRFRQHARCFGCRQDEPNECIVLEDLTCAGFSLHNRFSDLPVEHVRQVIRSYAKLHAISLAGKRQFAERMQPLRQLVDIFEQRREDHALGVYFENLKGSALSSLLSPGDDPYRARLEDYFARGSYFELLLPLVADPIANPSLSSAMAIAGTTTSFTSDPSAASWRMCV